jgi:outer membrane protein, heavy metal efflux system
MSRQLLIGIFWVGVLSSRASAQDTIPPGEPPLTLRAAVAEALEHNPELLALRAAHEAARSAPAQARYLAPPTLETQIWSWPVTTLNPAKTDMYMFMAEQELPGKGKRAARVQVGERDADLARQQIPVRANEILGDVKQAYVDLAFARELVKLYDGQRRVLEDITEAATVRYASGGGKQHHTVASLVELTRLEKDVVAVDERARSAEARLNAALGRRPAQPVEPLAELSASMTVADAERVAETNHPELAMADAAIAREEAELARVRGEKRPDYVIGGGYMLTPGDAGALTVRGGITWPNAPWSRGRLAAAIDAQEKRLAAAKAQREVVTARIRYRVRDVTVRMAAAERQARLIQTTVMPQVEHAFELTRVSYAGGEGDFMDVLESQRLLLETKLEYATARASISRAYADLETAAGVQ